MRAGFARSWLGALLPIVLVAIWWVLSAESTSPFFPPLPTILETFRDTWLSTSGRVGSDLLPSMRRMALGYLLALGVGVGVGVLLGRIRWLDRALQPTVQFLRAVPGIAFVPLAIAVLGIGDIGKIWLIAFVCCFPIMLSTIDGVRSVSPGLEDMAVVFQLSRLQRVLAVQLPTAALHIVAGMRIALSIAFILVIVSEMMGATDGVGFVTLNAQQSFQVTLMWSGMILLGVLGVALNTLFVLAERRLLFWHHRRERA